MSPNLQVAAVEIFVTNEIALGTMEPHVGSRKGKPIHPNLVASMFLFKNDMLIEY